MGLNAAFYKGCNFCSSHAFVLFWSNRFKIVNLNRICGFISLVKNFIGINYSNRQNRTMRTLRALKASRMEIFQLAVYLFVTALRKNHIVFAGFKSLSNFAVSLNNRVSISFNQFFRIYEMTEFTDKRSVSNHIIKNNPNLSWKSIPDCKRIKFFLMICTEVKTVFCRNVFKTVNSA